MAYVRGSVTEEQWKYYNGTLYLTVQVDMFSPKRCYKLSNLDYDTFVLLAEGPDSDWKKKSIYVSLCGYKDIHRMSRKQSELVYYYDDLFKNVKVTQELLKELHNNPWGGERDGFFTRLENLND